jgi:hypothetical protein
MLLEMNFVYQPMIRPALKAKAKINALIKKFQGLDRRETTQFVRKEVLPDILEAWRWFAIHRATQTQQRKIQRLKKL